MGCHLTALVGYVCTQGARHARGWLRRQRPALAKTRPVALPILLEVRAWPKPDRSRREAVD